MSVVTGGGSIAKKVKTTADKPDLPAVSDDQHQKVVELLRGRTMEMSFTVHGLPKSRKISGKLAEQVAASVAGKKKGVRASWSMFTSEHPRVKELNAAIRELDQLRDTWTIVRSADVQTGEGDKVTIQGGKRLIWDKDVPEFHALFVTKARQIDRCVKDLQHAMDHTTYDADDKPVPSVKEMDKANAGEAWDESVYPKDLNLIVGVSKEREADGSPRVDDDGNPIYVISFSEYHVSEKLPDLLRARAIKRIDDGLSSTIGSAMGYAVTELTDQMTVFLGELTRREKVYPPASGSLGYLYEADVVKTVTAAEDSKLPDGYVKVLIRYKEPDGDDKPVEGYKAVGEPGAKVTRWFGPMKKNDYAVQFRPQTSSEKKKIFPSVIEGIIEQLTAFRDKKAKMLGAYGDNLAAAFAPLLDKLMAAKAANPLTSTSAAAQKLAAVLRTDDEAKETLAKAVTDVVEMLEDQVTTVRETHKRRAIKASLIGQV